MNYPNGIKKDNNITLSTIKNSKNRGMTLENDLNETNEYYRDMDIAIIYKKPTPIKITKVDYPSRSEAKIKEAFFKEPSTTDYNGLYDGLYIDFEAKETTSKTSFPLANIHKHQINHIKNVIDNGGIGFLIVRFTCLNRNYILMGKDFIDYLDNNDRKSIPLDYFENKGHLLDISYMPRLDYLKTIDKIIGGCNGKKEK